MNVMLGRSPADEETPIRAWARGEGAGETAHPGEEP